MKCIGHADVDAVGTCVRCGCGLCQSCISGTFYRIDNKPLCKNCNYETCIENIQFFKSLLKSNTIRLRVFQATLAIGLIVLIYHAVIKGNLSDGIIAMLFFWGLGTFGNICGQRNKTEVSVRNQVHSALLDFHYPAASLIGQLIGVIIGFILMAIASPILTLLLVMNINKTKKQLVENETILNKIQAGAA
jgi:hypothetical protein